jgi:hypothetical protein
MSPLAAWRDGAARVAAAPAILAGVYAVTLLAAIPFGLALRAILADHLGASLAAERAAAGVNYDWWGEFSAQAKGLATTFTPGIIGFGAVLENLSAFLDNEPLAGSMAGVLTAYLLLWIFLSGGVLDRYARQRPTRSAGFFSACGVFFFRFLRLAVPAFVAYYALFAYAHGWLLGDLYDRLTREMTVERSAFAVRLLLYLVFGALLIACNVVFDYAKIRAVVEDRRSMIGALVAAVRFVRRRRGPVLALYLLNALVFLLLVAIYAAIAPGAGGAGLSMWLAFGLGQVYILARLWARLVFQASEIAFFQAELAHAEYVAAPQPIWPESPAAEALARLTVDEP